MAGEQLLEVAGVGPRNKEPHVFVVKTRGAAALHFAAESELELAAWVAAVKRGRILYEMEGVDPQVAREALRLAAHKLPVRTRFVERED